MNVLDGTALDTLARSKFETDASLGHKNGLPSVFVGNLEPEIGVVTIQKLFASFGEVRSCSIGRKTNKAFATVHLLSSAAVQAAVAALNGTQLNGRILHVEPYNKLKKKAGKNKEEQVFREIKTPKKELKSPLRSPVKPSRQLEQGECVALTLHFNEENNDDDISPTSPSNLLFPVRVGNLPTTATRSKLRALFTPFGFVKKLKLTQGRGVVWFDDPANASQAVTSLKGTVFEGELLSFERLPKPSLVPKSLLTPAQGPNALAIDPSRCLVIALFTLSAEKLLLDVYQAVKQIMDAAISLRIPVITADLLCESYVEAEVVPPKISFTNISTFDVTRNASVRKAIVDTKRSIAVVVGIETDVSVLQTALGLLDMQKTVFVVADAIATSDTISSSFALDRIRTAGVKITTKRSLISEWVGTVEKAEELKQSG